MDPAKFRAYLVGELGDKAADLMTVSRGDDKGGRPANGTKTSEESSEVSEADKRKAGTLRAILRAPEYVQQLYREDRITQADAARMGPKSPTPEQAAKLAEARQELERLDRKAPATEFRRQAKEAIARTLGSNAPTPLDLLRRAWAKASAKGRRICPKR